MKLFELTGIKHLAHQSLPELLRTIEKLVKSGNSSMKILGQGQSGIAIDMGDYAVRFWHRDRAYERFVEFCGFNRGNPFLPKFLSPIRSLPIKIDSEAYEPWQDRVKGIKYVKMEKLDTGIGAYEKIPLKLFANQPEIGNNLTSQMEVADAFLGNDLADVAIREIISEYLIENGVDLSSEELDDFIENNPIDENMALLCETIEQIIEYVFLHDKTQIDLHNDNFGFRGSQLVIFDPANNTQDMAITARLLRASDQS